MALVRRRFYPLMRLVSSTVALLIDTPVGTDRESRKMAPENIEDFLHAKQRSNENLPSGFDLN